MPAAFTLDQSVTVVNPETSTPRTMGAVTVAAAGAALATDAAREGAAAPSGRVRPAITASAAMMIAVPLATRTRPAVQLPRCRPVTSRQPNSGLGPRV